MNSSPYSVLIIEDDEFIRDSLESIFALEGFTTFTAINGAEGIALATEHHPTLIICDLAMPVVDGFGVLEAVKKDMYCKKIPFVVLTARVSPEEERKALAMGADSYLCKPIWPKQILLEAAKYID